MSKPTLKVIIALAEQRGITPEMLDEAVHDLKEVEASNHINSDDELDADATYDTYGDEAADINNDGLSAQLAYIAEQEGLQSAYELVNQLGGKA